MANICSFSMQVKGTRENIEKFFEAMTQAKDVWMGRGSEADIEYEDEDGRAQIDGWCKWSIQSALIDNALSMRKQQMTGEGYWYWGDEIQNVKEFITLFEACKKYNVNMEVYSEEPGCCFSEHYKYENGKILDECVDYEEHYDDDGNFIGAVGGYKDWYFDLEEVA